MKSNTIFTHLNITNNCICELKQFREHLLVLKEATHSLPTVHPHLHVINLAAAGVQLATHENIGMNVFECNMLQP